MFKPMIGMVFGREAGQLGLDQVAIGAGVDDGNLVVCFDRLQRSADASHEKFGVPTRVQAPNVVIGGFDHDAALAASGQALAYPQQDFPLTRHRGEQVRQAQALERQQPRHAHHAVASGFDRVGLYAGNPVP